ncbi:MAG: prepilin-type N-terminal cleavage/methylation domain-containing protein [bacterium]|nr:prepilin-type N-terminal cleavage/methylation domain-containing protein [bacterium]
MFTVRHEPKNRGGFTIVEIIIVIVVIAILAAISLVAYGGIKERAVASSIMSDLDKARKSIDMKSFTHTTQIDLPEAFSPSGNNQVEIVKMNLPSYKNMSPVQNGVLFYSICGDLVAAGYGKSENNGGALEQYITACNVYNYNQLQVNSSWSGHNFSTPVQSSALPDIVEGINYNDSWRPNRDQTEKDFYSAWASRFLAQGGSYPVTSFWDPWANDGNGGVKSQALPTPVTQAGKYCLEGYNQSYPDVRYMVVSGGSISEGACPTVE